MIGRDDSCDPVLDDPEVLRHHAEIIQSTGPLRRLHDLDSANGSLVNGQRVAAPLGFSTGSERTAELKGGEWLHFGNTRVLITLVDPKKEESEDET